MGLARNDLAALLCTVVLIASPPAYGLSVDMHGEKLVSTHKIGGCVDIGGEYEGFRVEATEVGTTPKICVTSRRKNKLTFHQVTLVGTRPSFGERKLSMEHTFAAGPRGQVYARVQFKGFFAQATGAWPPAGDKLTLKGFFSQSGHDDLIGEAIEHTVGDTIESALIDMTARKEYLSTGTRTLKGELVVSFLNSGDRLVIENDTAILLDGVKDFSEKLDTWGQVAPLPLGDQPGELEPSMEGEMEPEPLEETMEPVEDEAIEPAGEEAMEPTEENAMEAAGKEAMESAEKAAMEAAGKETMEAAEGSQSATQ